ncbi:hypothetical protein [Aeoliella sp.]|uniref:hypothetical protein n=1 Tax=Aeoliella sp. TaxID=2795800 RepID=UPI003CCBAF36
MTRNAKVEFEQPPLALQLPVFCMAKKSNPMNQRVAGLTIALTLLLTASQCELAWGQPTPVLAPRARVMQVQVNGSPAVIQVVEEDPFGMPSEPAAVEPAAEGSEDAQKAAQEQQEKQQRLQKIQQLQFDRRPSTMLIVWKQFELEKLKPAEEEETEEGATEADDAEESEEDSNPTKDKEAEPASEAEKATKAEEGSAGDKEATAEAGEEPTAASTDEQMTKQTATKDKDGAADEAATEASDSSTDESGEADQEDKAEEKNAAKDDESEKEASGEGETADNEGEKKSEEGKEEEEKKEEKEDKGPDFDKQLADLRRNVTLGRWPQVNQFIESLSEDEAKAVFKQIVRSLASPPNQPAMVVSPDGQNMVPVPNQRGAQPELNVMTSDDLLAIARLAPAELEDDDISMLAQLVNVYKQNGYMVEALIERLAEEVKLPEEQRALNSSQVAGLLIQTGLTLKAKDFLPSVEEAVENKQHKELIQLSKYYYALYREDHRIEDLEKAWQTVQEILSAEEVEEAQQNQALMRAVDLAPQVRDTLGQQWLADAFKNANERGIEILSTIGNQAATGLQARVHDPTKRLEILRLQSTAVEALVEASPEVAKSWQDKLTLLAAVWLREAQVSYQYDTSVSLGPALQRDMYGNFFYFDMNGMSRPRNNNQPNPIPVGEVLKVKPSDVWLEYVAEGLKPQMEKQVAQLLLKVNEEDAAFPYIERLANSHPKVADSLVSEFLRIWTDNHDPNSSRNRTNSYMFMYGYERRAESIPLTRSKQERNLEELSALVKRLNDLPLEDVDEQQLVRAFTTCHSSAEVYQLDAIAKVFGPLESLEPKTLAALGQQMRSNLVGMWRMPTTQKDAKTKRKQKDIAAEVERGYQVALAVVDGGLATHPEDWSLVLAKASILHDANDYRRTIAPDSKFVARQENAFGGFQRAAELYSGTVGDIREDEETTRPFEVWYYASMGACDPQRLDQNKPKDPKQLALIREAILALPGEAAQRHMDSFANSLFTRMSSIKPALKYRYLESGLSIVGDNERAGEARKIFDYYSDLVTEISLETKIDGDDVVGHEKPFGVFVNLVHTREIERESGGFSRYLQNQNNGSRYYYNYGRPLENYRDKFEEQVVSTVGDNFEVLSVTFQTEDVNSRSLPEYGWRYTPYAYVLLKAKGPEVDKLPALQLDLDFLDTSGYVVIPIASSPLPVDASATQRQPRPADHIAITQTLDEREAADGKLILEVKASSQGLVPELDELLAVEPEQFHVVEVEDEGLSVSRFDPDSPKNLILSERTWLVSMQAKEGLSAPPEKFEFAEPKVEVTESLYQRYDDADLLAVEPVIDLEATYASEGPSKWWWIGGVGLLVLLAIGAIVALAQGQPEVAANNEFAVPDRITPFTVLGLLDRIESRNGIDDKKRQELRQSRSLIEQFYFEEGDAPEPNLEEIAQSWSRQAKPRLGNNGR